MEFDHKYSMDKIFTRDLNGRNQIIVSVIDSGVGISQENRTKLFKLFGWLHTVEQSATQGIGLGLAISEKIVRAFNGRIGMRSMQGVGSQFSFSMMLNNERPDST